MSASQAVAGGGQLPKGAELVAKFIEASPFARHLGIRLAAIEPDSAQLELPFSESLVTIGDVGHGGAISTLVDTAATAAAWSTDELPETVRGTTVALNVTFVAAARARDLTAMARVLGRGRNLCFCEVDVRAGEAGTVARGLVTYKLG